MIGVNLAIGTDPDWRGESSRCAGRSQCRSNRPSGQYFPGATASAAQTPVQSSDHCRVGDTGKRGPGPGNRDVAGFTHEWLSAGRRIGHQCTGGRRSRTGSELANFELGGGTVAAGESNRSSGSATVVRSAQHSLLEGNANCGGV